MVRHALLLELLRQSLLKCLPEKFEKMLLNVQKCNIVNIYEHLYVRNLHRPSNHRPCMLNAADWPSRVLVYEGFFFYIWTHFEMLHVHTLMVTWRTFFVTFMQHYAICVTRGNNKAVLVWVWVDSVCGCIGVGLEPLVFWWCVQGPEV